MSDPTAVPPTSSYPLSRALPARVLGRGAMVTAAVVLVATLARTWSIAAWLLTGLTALAIALLTLVTVAAWAVVRPPTVLQLDGDGFRVRWLRSIGPTRGRWRQLTDVTTIQGPNGPVLVMRHDGGAQTRVPLGVLGASRIDMERDVHERLNSAHGYRRLT